MSPRRGGNTPESEKKAGRRKYSDQTKAAVLAALMAGQGVEYVAREYKVPEGTVKSWKARMTGPVSPVATQKREAIGELLVGYLEANLQTLRDQNKVFSDPEWLRKQDAADVAVLHGVIADKTVRLLEALSAGEQAT